MFAFSRLPAWASERKLTKVGSVRAFLPQLHAHCEVMDKEEKPLMDTFATDTGPYAFYETARSPVRTMSKVTATALHEGTITHDLHRRSGEARLSYAVEASGSATIDICQENAASGGMHTFSPRNSISQCASLGIRVLVLLDVAAQSDTNHLDGVPGE